MSATPIGGYLVELDESDWEGTAYKIERLSQLVTERHEAEHEGSMIWCPDPLCDVVVGSK